MNKLKSSEIISICSILAGILMVAIKDETPRVAQIIILSLFGVLLFGYGSFLLIKAIKNNRGVSSAAIIANAKKYTNKLVRLSNANARQMKKFDFLNGQKKIERQNNIIAHKCKGNIGLIYGCSKEFKLKNRLDAAIKQYTAKKSANYGDLNALISYNKMTKVMSESTLEKNYRICRNIISRIFDMNRILLLVEQHQNRIKLGRFIAYFTNNEEEQIKAYLDLIGWSYILIGDNKKGFNAILTAINIIESRIGTDYDDTVPKGIDKKQFYNYLFLKVRAYRHLGSTYYTYKSIDALFYCQKALKLLDTKGFKEGLNDDAKFASMRCGVTNNLYLSYFYKFVRDTRRGKGDIESLKTTLNGVEKDIEEIYGDGNKSSDQHRLIKLLTLKCQLEKALDISGAKKLDLKEFGKNMERIENVLNKSIYFDDAMEVYTNQKIQLLFEEVKNILVE